MSSRFVFSFSPRVSSLSHFSRAPSLECEADSSFFRPFLLPSPRTDSLNGDDTPPQTKRQRTDL